MVETNSPNGFGGAIDMMAGINSAGEVTGLAIITHAETSGLGSKATDPEWQAQFAGATDIVMCHQGWRYLRPSLVRPLPPAQFATASTPPCCCGSTGLRRDRDNECKETIF